MQKATDRHSLGEEDKEEIEETVSEIGSQEEDEDD